MPQLVPFYFVNEITITFILMVSGVYILSKTLLPLFVRLFIARLYINLLFK